MARGHTIVAAIAATVAEATSVAAIFIADVFIAVTAGVLGGGGGLGAAEETFARAEQAATRESCPLAEARRLTEMPDPLGQANWALVASDGTVSGNLSICQRKEGAVRGRLTHSLTRLVPLRPPALAWIRAACEHTHRGRGPQAGSGAAGHA